MKKKFYINRTGYGEMCGQPFYTVMKRGWLCDTEYADYLSQTEAELLCDLQNKNHPFKNGSLTEATLRQEARVKDLEVALADVLSTYTGSDKIVTAERIEAWQAVLNR